VRQWKRVLAAAALVVLLDSGLARAQFGVGPVVPTVSTSRFVAGGGLGFSYHRRGLRVAGFGGGFYSRSVFAAPVVPAWPVFPPTTFSVFPPVSMWTPFGWTPGFLPPGWGVGPGWGWGWYPPPVIVLPPPAILPDNLVGPDGNPALGFEELPRPIEPQLPRGAKPGDYIVISPKREAPGQIAPVVERVASVPRPQVPAFRFDPFAPRFRVDADRPELDPAKESSRLIQLGRDAFAAGEFGKAAEQFDRASAADPKLARAHFLKGQAEFAAGRYSDAVAAIRAALTLDPSWPTSTFDPKEPYGASAAVFANHIADLRKGVAANPGEASLEFLLGYQLWFIGERVEARKWFDAAASRLAEPGPLALFK
jgi:hypothetical protein